MKLVTPGISNCSFRSARSKLMSEPTHFGRVRLRRTQTESLPMRPKTTSRLDGDGTTQELDRISRSASPYRFLVDVGIRSVSGSPSIPPKTAKNLMIITKLLRRNTLYSHPRGGCEGGFAPTRKGTSVRKMGAEKCETEIGLHVSDLTRCARAQARRVFLTVTEEVEDATI
jgi:hypothetical protein